MHTTDLKWQWGHGDKKAADLNMLDVSSPAASRIIG